MTKNMFWPGEKNEKEETRFYFQCSNLECKPGRLKFHANWQKPGPALIPSGIDCPYCGEEAHWQMDGFCGINVVGKAGSHENPYYSRKLADSEHRWMELQIEEAKKAVDGEDQITGTAASPYTKVTPNYEELEKDGVIKRNDTETAAQRKRIIEDRAKKVAEQASDKIDREIERKHIGRRHDG